MSAYEQEVEFNLSESGVHPMLLKELLAHQDGFLEMMLNTEINYAHANGRPELRENIARLYKGASPENVLVTVGAIEANFNSMTAMLNRGDEVVIMLPNYMQVWGVARNMGYEVKTFSLLEEEGWAPDLETLGRIVSNKTRLIAICNPNNPTGYILKESEMEAIVNIAERVGAWILADEVYAGAEQQGEKETASFYGRYEKVLAVGSMSKAYGLPGLRTGWVAGPKEILENIWARHEYTTLSATMLSNKLTALALSPEVRPKIISRTRDYIRKGYPVLEAWMKEQGGILSCIPPQAAAIAFIKYDLDINSTQLATKLLREKSVLIIPGDHFGLDHYLRVSYGLPHDYLTGGLQRIGEVISELS
jgi:aspartate/methionine/tyrosine aminotransferase